jgi:hypothetical protein
MSSIMRWRNGVMLRVDEVMMLLLSKNEADCLIPQHRKQPALCVNSPSLDKPTAPDRSPLPRERFSPVSQSGRSAFQKADINEAMQKVQIS